MKNKIREELIRLGISQKNSFEKIAGRVRDKAGIPVLRCKKSGVILLGSTSHISEAYYEDTDNLSYWSSQLLHEAKMSEQEDSLRRADDIRVLITNKRWLDFGTGNGGIMDALKGYAKAAYGVELQGHARRALNEQGHAVFATIKDAPGRLEVVTMFHVMEHLLDPIKTLKSIRTNMKSGGKLVVEVPHAKDILISQFDLSEFKKFTFWSQHLILHTRESLRLFIEAAGFKNVVIKGTQRYPISNHLYWLNMKKPGGYSQWSYLNTPELTQAYGDMLARIDKTDTLIAYAEK